jgi:hypothetical protein
MEIHNRCWKRWPIFASVLLTRPTIIFAETIAEIESFTNTSKDVLIIMAIWLPSITEIIIATRTIANM